MMSNSKFKLGLVQMDISRDAEKNISSALSGISKAAKSGAHIVCLPELFHTEYFPQQERNDVFDTAEKIPGKITTILSEAAKENNVVLVGGSIFEADDGKFYNTSVIFDDNGEMLGKYRKIHIPQDPHFYEKNYFSPGNLGYKVFKTKHCNIGVLICYDQWYPEASRIVTLMGADIIFYPTTIGLFEGVEQYEGNWQDIWELVQKGHAATNNVVVATVNRVGSEHKMKFWGGSFVSNQFGNIIDKLGSKEDVLITECDLAFGKKVREGWRFLYNRRPETYKQITEKHQG